MRKKRNDKEQETIEAEKYAGKFTICQVCSKPARVKHTRRNSLADGRTQIIREMICDGQHRHRFTLTDIVKAADASAKTDAMDGDISAKTSDKQDT